MTKAEFNALAPGDILTSEFHGHWVVLEALRGSNIIFICCIFSTGTWDIGYKLWLEPDTHLGANFQLLCKCQ